MALSWSSAALTVTWMSNIVPCGCLNPNVFKRILYIRRAKLPRIKMSGPDGSQVDVKDSAMWMPELDSPSNMKGGRLLI